jgi:hypothetical protein
MKDILIQDTLQCNTPQEEGGGQQNERILDPH